MTKSVCVRLKVRYFLNEEGLKDFPSWYAEMSAMTAKQDGFVSLNCDNDGKTPVVFLEFESQSKLNAWTAKDTHDLITDRIEQYFIAPQNVEIV